MWMEIDSCIPVNIAVICRLLTNNAIDFMDDGAFAKIPLVQLWVKYTTHIILLQAVLAAV